MGYTTIFTNQFNIEPPLTLAEQKYIHDFSNSRRYQKNTKLDGMYDTKEGTYNNSKEYNKPPKNQPGLWSQWVPTKNGDGIQWNGVEKFYEAEHWITWMIEHLP